MEPNQMFTVGLVPSQQLVSLLTDGEGNWRDVPEGEAVVPLIKVPKPEQGAWEPNLVWFYDRVERQWVAGTPVPPPAVQAEEWLSSQGYSPLRLLTCLDLEAKLLAANKTAPKLAAVRQWIDGITLMAAPDPDASRSDFPAAPCVYAEAAAEAVAALAG